MSDDATLEGVQVSKSQLGAVFDYAVKNTERVVRMEGKIDSMVPVLAKLETSSTTLAEIAAARRKEELIDRKARLERETAEAKEKAQTKKQVTSFFSENWRYLLLIGLLIFYPQVVGQLQVLGILPQFSAPQQAQVVPAPAPAPAAVEKAAPVDETTVPDGGE